MKTGRLLSLLLLAALAFVSCVKKPQPAVDLTLDRLKTQLELQAPPLQPPKKKKGIRAMAVVPMRGVAGDLFADLVLGQRDFTDIVQFEVVPNRVGAIGGVMVDQARDILYIVDVGNNRILAINPKNGSVLFLLGQESASDHSACNGDSGFQSYPSRPAASPDGLCLLPESVLSSTETLVTSQMKLDPNNGDLYIPDVGNNRIKKYSWVGSTLTPVDFWGQPDWAQNTCNNNGGPAQDQFGPAPSATTLCFGAGGAGGVEFDGSGGLWIADYLNNRVVHFPVGSKTADIALGQPNLTTGGYYHGGSGPNQLSFPRALRMFGGELYVAGGSGINVYAPPFTTGMAAARTLPVPGSGNWAFGLEVDPQSRGLWVQTYRSGPLLFNSTGATLQQAKAYGGGGSVGFDGEGNMYVGAGPADVCKFVPDGSGGFLGGIGYFNFSDCNGVVSYPGHHNFWNMPTGRRVAGPNSPAIFGDQLIVGFGTRMLAWNGLSSLSNGKHADVVVGQPDFLTVPDWTGEFYGAHSDAAGRLWVAYNGFNSTSQLRAYAMPLVTGATPLKTLTFSPSTPPVTLDGAVVAWPNAWSILYGLCPVGDGSSVWVSNQASSRVFRVRNPLTDPVVDVILGQKDASGTLCNRGEFPVGSPDVAADMLCRPGAVEIDRLGNLWVADSSPEADGNGRLLMFDAALFPKDNVSVIYAPAATKVFPNNLPQRPAAVSIAFDSANRMLLGYNPYTGMSRFVGIYDDPLGPSMDPTRYMADYNTWVNGLRFDGAGNLYLTDGNRNRILVYLAPFGAAPLSPSPIPATATATAIPATAIPTATLTDTPAPRPTPTAQIATPLPPPPTATKWVPPGQRKKTPSVTPLR